MILDNTIYDFGLNIDALGVVQGKALGMFKTVIIDNISFILPLTLNSTGKL